MPNKYYKTQFCKKVKDNQDCPYPDRWHYAHSQAELRKQNDPLPKNYIDEIADAQTKYYNTHFGNYKTLVWKYALDGKQWRFADCCLYAHNEDELRQEGTPLTITEIRKIYLALKEQERLQSIAKSVQQAKNAPVYQTQFEPMYNEAADDILEEQQRPQPTSASKYPPPSPPDNSLLDQLNILQSNNNETDCSLIPADQNLPMIPNNNMKILVADEPFVSITYSLIQKTLQLIENNFIEDARSVLVYLIKQKYIEFEPTVKQEDDSTMDVDL